MLTRTNPHLDGALARKYYELARARKPIKNSYAMQGGRECNHQQSLYLVTRCSVPASDSLHGGVGRGEERKKGGKEYYPSFVI